MDELLDLAEQVLAGDLELLVAVLLLCHVVCPSAGGGGWIVLWRVDQSRDSAPCSSCHSAILE
ncbi:hypothetical protein ACFPRL_04255 [Pseudoclavibacter helvolus]